MDKLDQKVYSKEVIEFTAVANEYCAFIESAGKYEGIQILKFMQKLLPLLYTKILALPEFESLMEDELEKFVKENDWQAVHDIVIVKLGEANDYMEVFDEQAEYSGDAVLAGIAENLSDIYQDLKDYLVSYSIGTIELMNEALWNCLDSFNLYWGQKLVNVLRAIHNALKNPDKIGQEVKRDQFTGDDIDTSDWIISQRQSQMREGGEKDDL